MAADITSVVATYTGIDAASLASQAQLNNKVTVGLLATIAPANGAATAAVPFMPNHIGSMSCTQKYNRPPP